MAQTHTHTHNEDRPVVVNNEEDRSSVGTMVGIILAVLIGLLLLFYGLPMLINSVSRQSTPSVNVPDRVDVNVNE